MNRHNVENYKMLIRVADFATKNVGLLPKSSPGSEIQKALAKSVRELDELSSARISAESAMRSGRKDRGIARNALRALLSQASRTARAVNSEALRPADKMTTDHALITAGRAFTADIEPIKKEFLVYGISPENVVNAVQVLESAIRDHSAAKAKRSAAIRTFDEKVEAAMGLMRRFEALVVNILAKDTSVMTEWKAARTIGRVTTRKRAVKAEEPPTPAVPPVAA